MADYLKMTTQGPEQFKVQCHYHSSKNNCKRHLTAIHPYPSPYKQLRAPVFPPEIIMMRP